MSHRGRRHLSLSFAEQSMNTHWAPPMCPAPCSGLQQRKANYGLEASFRLVLYQGDDNLFGEMRAHCLKQLAQQC